MNVKIDYNEAPGVTEAVTNLNIAIADHTKDFLAKNPMTANDTMLVMHQTLIQAIGLLCSIFTRANIAMVKDIAKKQHGGN